MNPRTAVIIGCIALLLGAAGLVVGISAKNGNKSDSEISEQISDETSGTSETASAADKEAKAAAAEDRKNKSAQSSNASEIAKLRTQIADLTAQLDKAQTDFSAAAQGAEAKVAVARGLPEGSEPWIDANVALAGLDVLRGQASDALEALEQLAIERGRGGQPPYPGLDAAIARARALADDQARRIRTLESSLAN